MTYNINYTQTLYLKKLFSIFFYLVKNTNLALFIAFILLFHSSISEAIEITGINKTDIEFSKYVDANDRVKFNNKDLTVVVAISGGGYRASNYGIGALLALEKIETNHGTLLQEIDYYSTVSGGGLSAAAHIIGLIDTIDQNNSDFSLKSYLEEDDNHILLNLRKNHGWRLLASMLNPHNIFSKMDRGDSLQKRLDQKLFRLKNKNTSLNFGHIFRLKKEHEPSIPPITPYWIANSTRYSDGSIFPFTPDVLQKNKVSCYVNNKTKLHIDTTSLNNYLDIPMALAARTSMNFPVGIPSTTLDINLNSEFDTNNCKNKNSKNKDFEFIRLTDGGEADNLGIYTAMQILNYDREIKPKQKQLLIIIDVFNGSIKTTGNTERSPYFYEAMMRAMSLPLDAHRFRINTDFQSKFETRNSLINSIKGTGVTGIVLSDINNVIDSIKNTSTTLWMGEKRQCQLIQAGFDSTMKALGESIKYKDENYIKVCKKHIIPDSVLKKTTNNNSVLMFNRNGKLTKRNNLIQNSVSTLLELQNKLNDTYKIASDKIFSSLENNIQNENKHLIDKELKLIKAQLIIPEISKYQRNSILNPIKKLQSDLIDFQKELIDTSDRIDEDISNLESNNLTLESIKEDYNFSNTNFKETLDKYKKDLLAINKVNNELFNTVNNSEPLKNLMANSTEFESKIREFEQLKLLLINDFGQFTDFDGFDFEFSKNLKSINNEIIMIELSELKGEYNASLIELIKKNQSLSIDIEKLTGYYTNDKILDLKKQIPNLPFLRNLKNTIGKTLEINKSISQLLSTNPYNAKDLYEECNSINDLTDNFKLITSMEALMFGKYNEQHPLLKNAYEVYKNNDLSNDIKSIEFEKVYSRMHSMYKNWPNLSTREHYNIDQYLEKNLSSIICIKKKPSSDTKITFEQSSKVIK